MTRGMQYRWLLVVAVALAAGSIGWFWPHNDVYTPVFAVATDRIDTYGMATGPVDSDVEAVYFLDFLTGDLRAVVLGKQGASWTGFFQANVAADLKIDPQKNPRYMMVTGNANLRRAGGSQLVPSSSMCYVTEVTSGGVAAYAIPWSSTMYAGGRPQTNQLRLIGVTAFRQPMGVGPDSGAGAAPTGKHR